MAIEGVAPGSGAGKTRRQAMRSWTAATLGAAGIAAAGCARGEAGPKNPAALRTDVTVSFLQTSGQVESDLVNQVVDRWKQAHPNGPKAEFVVVTGTVTEKYSALLAGGTPPALVSMDAAQGVVYADRGDVAPLDEYIKRDHYDLNDYIPASLEQYRWKGKLFALLRDFSHQAMWVNTDLLAKEGITPAAGDYSSTTGGWDFNQLLDVSRRLTKSDGGSAARAAQYGFFVTTDISGGYGQFIWANGGDLFDKDFKKCVVDDERCVEALQLMQDMRSRYRVAPDATALQELKTAGLPNNAQTMFYEDMVAFAFFPVARIGEARKSAKGRWDLIVAPHGAKGKAVTSGGGVGWYLTKSIPYPEEAWALLEHLTSAETHKLLADVRIPGRKSVLDWWLAQAPGEAPKSRSVARTGQEAVHSRPVFPLWDRVDREVFTPQLARLWDNKATAKEVAAEAVAQANRILAEGAK